MEIVWTTSTSAQSIRASASARLSGAQMVEEFLEGLLSSSRSLYVAAVAGRQDSGARSRISSAWWSIEVQQHKHNSYAYELRRLEDGSEFNFSWANVPGIASTGSQPMAPSVLEAFLYYTKNLVNF